MITPRDRALLRLGLIDTAAMIELDLALIGDGTLNDVDEVMRILDELPNAAKSQLGPWLLRFRATCDDLIGDIDEGRDPFPRNTAEEILLHLTIRRLSKVTDFHPAIVNAAMADLPISEQDYDWWGIREDLFEDSDVEILFYPAFDGIENDDQFAHMGLDMLRPDHWFTWFGTADPRPHRPEGHA